MYVGRVGGAFGHGELNCPEHDPADMCGRYGEREWVCSEWLCPTCRQELEP